MLRGTFGQTGQDFRDGHVTMNVVQQATFQDQIRSEERMMFLASTGQVKHKKARDTITAEPTPRSPPCPSKPEPTAPPLHRKGHAKEAKEPASAPIYSSFSHTETPTTAQVMAETSSEPCAETDSSPPGSRQEKKSPGPHCCPCCGGMSSSSALHPPRSARCRARLDRPEAQALPTENACLDCVEGGAQALPRDSLSRPRSAGLGCRPQSRDYRYRSTQKKQTHCLVEGGEVPSRIVPMMAGSSRDACGSGSGTFVARDRPASAGGFGAFQTRGLLKSKKPPRGNLKGWYGKSAGSEAPSMKDERKCYQRYDQGSPAATATATATAAATGHAQPSQGYRRQRMRSSSSGNIDHYRGGSSNVKRHTIVGGRNRTGSNSAVVSAASAARLPNNAADVQHTRIIVDSVHRKASKDHRSTNTQAWGDPHTLSPAGARAGAPASSNRIRGRSADSNTTRGSPVAVAGRNWNTKARTRTKGGGGGGGGGAFGEERSSWERPSSAPPGKRRHDGACLRVKQEGGDGSYGEGGGEGGGGGGGGGGGAGAGGAGGGDTEVAPSLMRNYCRRARTRASALRGQASWARSGRGEDDGLCSSETPVKALPGTEGMSGLTASSSHQSRSGRGSGRNGSSARSKRSALSRNMNGSSSESRLHDGVLAEERRVQLRVELELIRRRLHDTAGLLQKVDNSLQSRSRIRPRTATSRTRWEGSTARFKKTAASVNSMAASAGTSTAKSSAGDGVPSAGEHLVSPLVVTHSAHAFLDQL